MYDISKEEDSAVSIHSGFPNPAADSDRHKQGLSLDALLLNHPSSNYLFRLSGHADSEFNDGDIAVVDRAVSARPHDLVVIWQDDSFELVKRHSLPRQTTVWGTVTAIVHRYRAEQ